MIGIVASHLNKYKELPLPVKTSIIYMFCSILQKGIAFIAIPIYTRLVSSNQYGVYSLYQSWDSILIVFATLNMWNYLFNNGMIKYERQKDEFTSGLLGLNFSLTTILFFIYILIYKWFEAVSGLSFVVMILMFTDFYLRPSYEYWCSRQRFEYNVRKYAISAIIITIITPVVSVLLICIFKSLSMFNLGVTLIAGKVFCAGLIYFIVMISILQKHHKLYNKKIWKFALAFNIPLIPHFLSTIILSQSDRIMIGSLCGVSEAAIYSVAYSVAAVMLIVNSSAMDSIIPWVYKCLKEKDYRRLPLVATCSLVLVASLNILVSICAPEIIAFMAPEEYWKAIYIIPPVAVSNIFIFMFNLYANIEYFYEKTKLVAMASCGSAIINVLLNYIFIKEYGFIAAGYTTIVCYILYAFCHYCFMRYVLKSHNIQASVYNNLILWGIGMGSVIISILIMFLYPYKLIRWGIILGLFMLVLLNKKNIIKLVVNLNKLGKENKLNEN